MYTITYRQSLSKIIIILLIFTLFLPNIQRTYATENIQILIDNTPIAFETKPKILNGHIMVPMSEFFNAIGADMLWIKNQNLAVAYKDNMHLKLYINSDTAYENGHPFKLSQIPLIEDNHIYLPIDIIANIFNMNPNWDDQNKILNLDNSFSNTSIKTFNNTMYQTHTIKKLGVVLSTPYNWSQLPNEVEFNFMDDYSMSIFSQNIPLDTNNIDLEQKALDLLDSRFDNRVAIISTNKYLLPNSIKMQKIIFDTWDKPPTPTITSISENDSDIENNIEDDIEENTVNNVDNIDINEVHDDATKLDNTMKHTENNIEINPKPNKKTAIIYILTSSHNIYYLICEHGKFIDLYEAENIFDNIITTFTIRNESIDTEEEHYVEFSSFYENNINLSKRYHSNMVINNSKLEFIGSISPQHSFDHLKAVVSHKNESLSFLIPITDNAFNTSIPLPFGLGQHNLKIFGVQNIQNDIKNPSKIITSEIPLMQFSIINIDANTTRYLIPTYEIQSDDEQIIFISRSITNESKNIYQTAYNIFNWVTNNSTLSSSSDNNIISNYTIIQHKMGNMEQLNKLMTAMFRSINIPARVVSGKKNDHDIYFWTEIYINGQWLCADPINDIIYFQNNYLAPTNSKFTTIKIFRERFTDVKIQNY